MLFATAGIEVAPWLPVLVAFAISFLTSMGGVSGAFLLLPFQMSILGYTHPSVSATNQVYNVVAIPSGVCRYYREGRLVWPLSLAVVIGTLPGVFIGAILRVAYLPDPRDFKLFAAAVLLYIGIRLVCDLLRRGDTNQGVAEERFRELVRRHRQQSAVAKSAGQEPLPAVTAIRFDLRRLGYSFYGEHFDVSVPGVVGLSLVVGVVGGVYGVGGGAILAPIFVSYLGLPVYTVAGAALLGTFVTSAAAVVFYQAIAPFYPHVSVAPDWLLGGLFGLGGMSGIYLGARCQKFVPARAIKWMLAAITLFTAAQYTATSLGL